MEVRRAQQNEQAAREQARFFRKMVLVFLGWLALGALLMGYSFHTTNQDRAQLAFQLSFLVGYGGMYFTAVWAYVRGKERGDW